MNGFGSPHNCIVRAEARASRDTERLTLRRTRSNSMSNTAIFIVIAIVVIGGIFWLVIYAGRRGERHRQKTSIKVSDSPPGGRTS